ncbi:MAG: glycosyltransferase family 2 protein, partial [Chloroflexota bacterium]
RVASSRVALVIPAWNEADCIGAVLNEVPPNVAQWTVVVCGHSTDGTDAIARDRGAEVVDDNAVGYGAACWAGVVRARQLGAEVIAFLDGDYSDPPSALAAVLSPLLVGQTDLALGVREMHAAPEALPIHARLGNRLVLAALHGLTGYRLADLPSFKALRLETLDRLGMSEMTYGWTTEMLVKAVRLKLRIAEIPITYRPRLGGRSKVSGTVRGTAGAAWKLSSCAVKYARWTPVAEAASRSASR